MVKTVTAVLYLLFYQGPDHHGQIPRAQIEVWNASAEVWCSRDWPTRPNGNHRRRGLGLVPRYGCLSRAFRVELKAYRLPWLRRRRMQVNWRYTTLTILITRTSTITGASRRRHRRKLLSRLFLLT